MIQHKVPFLLLLPPIPCHLTLNPEWEPSIGIPTITPVEFAELTNQSGLGRVLPAMGPSGYYRERGVPIAGHGRGGKGLAAPLLTVYR